MGMTERAKTEDGVAQADSRVQMGGISAMQAVVQNDLSTTAKKARVSSPRASLTPFASVGIPAAPAGLESARAEIPMVIQSEAADIALQSTFPLAIPMLTPVEVSSLQPLTLKPVVSPAVISVLQVSPPPLTNPSPAATTAKPKKAVRQFSATPAVATRKKKLEKREAVLESRLKTLKVSDAKRKFYPNLTSIPAMGVVGKNVPPLTPLAAASVSSEEVKFHPKPTLALPMAVVGEIVLPPVSLVSASEESEPVPKPTLTLSMAAVGRTITPPTSPVKVASQSSTPSSSSIISQSGTLDPDRKLVAKSMITKRLSVMAIGEVKSILPVIKTFEQPEWGGSGCGLLSSGQKEMAKKFSEGKVGIEGQIKKLYGWVKQDHHWGMMEGFWNDAVILTLVQRINIRNKGTREDVMIIGPEGVNVAQHGATGTLLKKPDRYRRRYVFTPVNVKSSNSSEQGDHWVVVGIDNERRQVQIFDSLIDQMRYKGVAETFVQFYNKLTGKEYKVVGEERVVHKQTGNDCAIHCVVFMDYLSVEPDIAVLPMVDADTERARLTLVLMNNKLGWPNNMNLEVERKRARSPTGAASGGLIAVVQSRERRVMSQQAIDLTAVGPPRISLPVRIPDPTRNENFIWKGFNGQPPDEKTMARWIAAVGEEKRQIEEKFETERRAGRRQELRPSPDEPTSRQEAIEKVGRLKKEMKEGNKNKKEMEREQQRLEKMIVEWDGLEGEISRSQGTDKIGVEELIENHPGKMEIVIDEGQIALVTRMNNFISTKGAIFLHEELTRLRGLFTRDTRMVNGCVIPTGRATFHMGEFNLNYTYAGVPHVARPFSPIMRQLITYIRGLDNKFRRLNYCVINYYSSGKVGMGYHSDIEKQIDQLSPIVSISLGDSRRFVMKNKNTKKETGIELHHRSLLIMYNNTQQNYVHSVNKSRSRGHRWNLTFRETIRIRG